MATEMITLRLEDKFLKDIDKIVKKEGYQNRTEFIRDAVRKKIEEIELKKVIAHLSKYKGISKKKISEEEYEKAREEAFYEISKKFK